MPAFTMCFCPKCGRLMMWVEGEGWVCMPCDIVCPESAIAGSTLPPLFLPQEGIITDLIPGA